MLTPQKVPFLPNDMVSSKPLSLKDFMKSNFAQLTYLNIILPVITHFLAAHRGIPAKLFLYFLWDISTTY